MITFTDTSDTINVEFSSFKWTEIPMLLGERGKAWAPTVKTSQYWLTDTVRF